MLGRVGFVLRRVRAQRVVLGAAFATILLAATVLSLIGLYVALVTANGMQRALAQAPPPDRAMEVREGIEEAATFPTRDTEVRTALAGAFQVVGADVFGSAVSSSYALPFQPGREVRNLTVFAFYDQLRDQTSLVDGRWPRPTGSGTVPVALSLSAARELDLAPGATFQVVNRLTDEPVSVSVSGLYTVDDPSAAYWVRDDLVDGAEVISSFTTYGPLVVPPSTFLDLFASDATARWRVDPRLGELAVADLPALRRDVAALDADDAGALGGEALVDSGLDGLLAGVQTPLVVARSAVTMPVALLVVLAGYTLLLTTRLLREHRSVETALLRARGMSARQLVAHSLREAVILGVPAALLAPWLAALLLRGYAAAGPLSHAGATVGLPPPRTTWLIAAVVATCAVAVLVVPGQLRAETWTEARQSRGRQSLRSGWQRAGGDLLLAVVAGLAYWQLTRYGTPVLTDVTGRLAVDPLLVLAPALVLLAGAVLALRLLPVLAAVAERLVGRSRGATGALGAWQVSRRPRRYTGPALLLVMATAVGAFSVTYAAAWSRSQADQADFASGADLRLEANPQAEVPGDVERVPGVAAVLPVARERASFGELTATVLAVDAATAADVVVLRPDLAAQRLPALADLLRQARPELPAFPVPASAVSLTVPLRVATRGANDPQVDLSAVLRDRSGLLHRVSLGSRLADSRRRTVGVDISDLDEPVRLVALEVRYQSLFGEVSDPADDALRLRVGVPVARAADETSLGPLAAPAGTSWGIRFDKNNDSPPSAKVRGKQPDRPVRAVLDAGFSSPVLFSVALVDRDRAPAQTTLPALVSPDLAASLGDVDTFALQSLGASLRLRVVGVLTGVPTVDPGRSAGVVVDLPSVSVLSYQQTRTVPTVDEWWLRVPRADTARAVADIRAHHTRFDATLLVRAEAAAALRADPVGAGIVGALGIGFLAAAAFAVIGFAVSASVSARERRGEFALLRAVGVGSRQLIRLLALEQAVLIGVGISAGVLLGVVVARLVAPLVTLTAQASRAFPPVLVPLPWQRLGLLALAVVATLALVLAVLSVRLRRAGTGSAAWLDEDA